MIEDGDVGAAAADEGTVSICCCCGPALLCACPCTSCCCRCCCCSCRCCRGSSFSPPKVSVVKVFGGAFATMPLARPTLLRFPGLRLRVLLATVAVFCCCVALRALVALIRSSRRSRALCRAVLAAVDAAVASPLMLADAPTLSSPMPTDTVEDAPVIARGETARDAGVGTAPVEAER